MSHVTCINQSTSHVLCHVMSHTSTRHWVMYHSHQQDNESCPMSRLSTSQQVMYYVTHTNKAMGHVSSWQQDNESCPRSRLLTSHVSCHTHQQGHESCIIIWTKQCVMSHVTCINKSTSHVLCHTHEQGNKSCVTPTSHWVMYHVTFINKSTRYLLCLTHEQGHESCDMISTRQTRHVSCDVYHQDVYHDINKTTRHVSCQVYRQDNHTACHAMSHVPCHMYQQVNKSPRQSYGVPCHKNCHVTYQHVNRTTRAFFLSHAHANTRARALSLFHSPSAFYLSVSLSFSPFLYFSPLSFSRTGGEDP